MPQEVIYRKAFPGPALSARIIGPVTSENLKFEKRVHDIVESTVDDYYLENYGKSMIINDKGEYNSFAGGYVYLDTINNLLFSIYDSDSNGISLYDLNNDILLFKIYDLEEGPYDFYISDNNRYYFRSYNYNTNNYNFWEIEIDSCRVKKVDDGSHDFKLNELYRLIGLGIHVNCE